MITGAWMLISNLFGMGTDYLKDKREAAAVIRKADVEIKVATAKSQISRLERAQSDEQDWNIKAMDASATSWKDEYLTLVLTIPVWMCFVPFLSPFVGAGFAVLSTTPLWYQSALGVVIAASFGYQKFAKLMDKRAVFKQLGAPG
jgi:hypothetical protein